MGEWVPCGESGAMKTVLLGVIFVITATLAHAEDMAEMISQYRRAHGLSAVRTDPNLTAIADVHPPATVSDPVAAHLGTPARTRSRRARWYSAFKIKTPRQSGRRVSMSQYECLNAARGRGWGGASRRSINAVASRGFRAMSRAIAVSLGVPRPRPVASSAAPSQASHPGPARE
jgi:hypothetical protein